MDLINNQERLFEVFDKLIDEGKVIHDEIQRDGALRKRVLRNFPPSESKSSTRVAMEAYGFIFDKNIPSTEELQNCWLIGDRFELLINEEVFNDLMARSNLSPLEMRRLVRQERKVMELEALSEFVRETSPELISYKNLRKYPHLRSYITSNFDLFEDFREAFNIDYRLVFYNSPSLRWIHIFNGLSFEKLLEEHLFGTEASQVPYKDSRPDFVVEGEWIDAKLSKGTALDYRDDTIEKYLRHTDHLTIIYAIDDGADTSAVEEDYNVEFKHVSEFYERMNDEAIAEFEELIERSSVVKGISL